MSGTEWESPVSFKPHNMAVEYAMSHITDCDSPLENDRTADIVCDVTVNCGCTFTAPYSWGLEAISSIKGSSLGAVKMVVDKDGRIERKGGIRLLPSAGNVGESFDLVAFGGDVKFYERQAARCRKESQKRPENVERRMPTARVLMRAGFTYEKRDFLRQYGFVDTGGCGNLLLCRKKPGDSDQVVGVCIDDEMLTRREKHTVHI